MKLLGHFLAESANFGQDGTISIFKGGITTVTASQLPTAANAALLRFVVVTMLEMSPEEATLHLHQMQLNIMLPDGSLHSGVRQPIAVKVADESLGRIYANVITQLNVIVPSAGDVRISGQLDGENLPLLYLNVRTP